MVDCVFCRIINKEIPSTVVYEDDELIAINDINPVAPVHVLIIPKKHLISLNNAGDDDGPMLGRMMLLARNIAREVGLDDRGFRTVVNNGAEGGQIVMHLHMHLIGGKQLGHKMG